ncbi:hypothetical protein R6Q59_012487 [Mikania micrantha]
MSSHTPQSLWHCLLTWLMDSRSNRLPNNSEMRCLNASKETGIRALPGFSISVSSFRASGQASLVPKISSESEENLLLFKRFMNTYNAFIVGELALANLTQHNLEEINLAEFEEMDISWQMAMAVFRAKKFIKKYGRNSFGNNPGRKLGFDKSKLRCYNRDQPGHFARECKLPKVVKVADKKPEEKAGAGAGAGAVRH